MATVGTPIKTDAEANGTRKAAKVQKTIRTVAYGVGGVILLVAITCAAYWNTSTTGNVVGYVGPVATPATTQTASAPVITWLGYANLAPKGQDGYLSGFYDYSGRGRPVIGPDDSGIKIGGCGHKVLEGYERVACNGISDQAFYIENETSAPVSKHVGITTAY